jgi:hypothetical protein
MPFLDARLTGGALRAVAALLRRTVHVFDLSAPEVVNALLREVVLDRSLA